MKRTGVMPGRYAVIEFFFNEGVIFGRQAPNIMFDTMNLLMLQSPQSLNSQKQPANIRWLPMGGACNCEPVFFNSENRKARMTSIMNSTQRSQMDQGVYTSVEDQTVFIVGLLARSIKAKIRGSNLAPLGREHLTG